MQGGLVFFGTPHPSFRHRDKWINLGYILKLKTKIKREVLAQAEQGWPTVASVSKAFEECGLETSVITVYETKISKLSSGVFKSRKEIV
jgi:hypothetical protein